MILHFAAKKRVVFPTMKFSDRIEQSAKWLRLLDISRCRDDELTRVIGKVMERLLYCDEILG
jgi:hypothetical protein